MKTDLFIEVNGEHTDCARLVDMAKEIWKSEGKKVKDIEMLALYYKPEEKMCYYVINGESKGSFHV